MSVPSVNVFRPLVGVSEDRFCLLATSILQTEDFVYDFLLHIREIIESIEAIQNHIRRKYFEE